MLKKIHWTVEDLIEFDKISSAQFHGTSRDFIEFFMNFTNHGIS